MKAEKAKARAMRDRLAQMAAERRVKKAAAQAAVQPPPQQYHNQHQAGRPPLPF